MKTNAQNFTNLELKTELQKTAECIYYAGKCKNSKAFKTLKLFLKEPAELKRFKKKVLGY